MSETPKSALELVMERLKKKDADAGITEKPLTDEQRAAIAEARSVYDARRATGAAGRRPGACPARQSSEES